MKIKKLLSLLMMLNDEFRYGTPDEYDKNRVMEEVDRLYKRVQGFLDDIPSLEDQIPPLPADRVQLSLDTKDGRGRAVSAQVKFFPLYPGRSAESFSKQNGRIDMTLLNTGMDGLLSAELPRYIHRGFAEGHIEVEEVTAYFVEVSRGSEYEILTRVVDIGSRDEIPLGTQTLRRLVDLSKEGWIAGDLHHHSIFSSPVHGGTDDVKESPEEVRTAMTAMGLSFGALSDHHNILNHREWSSLETDDFIPLISKEISTGNGHVMALNVPFDVIYDILPPGESSDESRYREFLRIIGEIKKSGGLAQINHPRDIQPAISLSPSMEEHVEIFDTMEIWNGSVPMMPGTTNCLAYKFWLDLLRQDRFVAATTGSDTHNVRADDYHRLMDEILWIKYHLGSLHEKDEGVEHFLSLIERSLDPLELWAEESLGTACVRTYIHLPAGEGRDRGAILSALREGRSFLTNGPVLIPRVQGKSCGETVSFEAGSGILSLACTILTRKPVKELEVIGKKGLLARKDLTGTEPGSLHRIDLDVDCEMLENQDWLVCRVRGDHTRMAIANPVFLVKK